MHDDNVGNITIASQLHDKLQYLPTSIYATLFIVYYHNNYSTVGDCGIFVLPTAVFCCMASV